MQVPRLFISNSPIDLIPLHTSLTLKTLYLLSSSSSLPLSYHHSHFSLLTNTEQSLVTFLHPFIFILTFFTHSLILRSPGRLRTV